MPIASVLKSKPIPALSKEEEEKRRIHHDGIESSPKL
jgi:hypothetical protein